MRAYNKFASVYDLFMGNAPYDEWTDYILEIWQRLNYFPKLVLDLACGTGNMTIRLSKKGFDMIGIDISEEMLMAAREKSHEFENSILYLRQDMCEFELYGTVDAIVCICDGINYLTENGQIYQAFKLIKNYLNPGGYFIFDINTEHKFKNILSNNFYSEVLEEAAYIWQNYYDEDERINEYQATFFTKNNQNNFYERFDELHYERAYSIDEISKLIELAGLRLVDIYDDLTFDEPNSKSERIFFVVKRT